MAHGYIIGRFASLVNANAHLNLNDHWRVSKSALSILSANLKALKEAGAVSLSQKAIAKKAGVDQTTVSRTLTATNAPGVDKLDGLAKAFGVQAWQLLVADFDPAKPPVLAAPSPDPRADELAEIWAALPEPRRRVILALADQLRGSGGDMLMRLFSGAFQDALGSTQAPDRHPETHDTTGHA